jgi:hypothetical protein
VKDAVSYSGKTVKTEGTVSAVCQGSGCWMTLKSGDQKELSLVASGVELVRPSR